jgi:SAM-dependent methyltransferase
MNETSKSKQFWGPLEHSVLTGKGIDIGCGPDPVTPNARPFDVAEGDANTITQYVKEQFDFVYSSHCLEHMHDPWNALLEWWQLVRPGGHLFFLVPDEDLYEQGFFPSRFNKDHKSTFTLSKRKSWSPKSVNVLDLARSLPNGELISLELQDFGYDRRLMRHANPPGSRLTRWLYYRLKAVTGIKLQCMAEDQTVNPDVVAQIQCIVKKRA